MWAALGHIKHIKFKKLSKAWVAMVIVNVHVFDFLIHLSKFAFCDISFKYPLKFKKKKH